MDNLSKRVRCFLVISSEVLFHATDFNHPNLFHIRKEFSNRPLGIQYVFFHGIRKCRIENEGNIIEKNPSLGTCPGADPQSSSIDFILQNIEKLFQEITAPIEKKNITFHPLLLVS